MFWTFLHDKEDRMVCHKSWPPWPVLPVTMAPVPAAALVPSSLTSRSFDGTLQTETGHSFLTCLRNWLALAEGIAHAHARENGLESITLFQFELGDVYLHIILTHGVLAGATLLCHKISLPAMNPKHKTTECLAEKDNNL